MTNIDKYNWTRTLAELKSFSNFLSCSVCSSPLTTSTINTNKCQHLFCSQCYDNLRPSKCPSCEVPTQPRDYKPNRIVTQVAQCLQNIEKLLLRRPEEQSESCNGDNIQAPPPHDQENSLSKDDGKAIEPIKKRPTRNAAKAIQSAPKVVAKIGARKTKSLETAPKLKCVAPSVEKGVINSRKRNRTNTTEVKRPRTNTSETKTSEMTERKPSNLDKKKPQKQSTVEKKNAKGETALHVACRKGQTAVVLQLLARGSDPNTRDYAGWTPLHEVSSHGKHDIAESLLKAGANPSVPSDDDRLTPLHDAVSYDDVNMVRLLVSYGADTAARDKNGDTPLSLATTADIRDALINTKVIVDLNESVRTKMSRKEIIVCASKRLWNNSESKKILESASRIGIRKIGTDFTPSTTHLIIDKDEELRLSQKSFRYLAALVTGIEIVRMSWMVESLELSRVIEDTSAFIVEFDEADKEGAEKYKQLHEAQQPRLMAGLHFYLLSNVTKKEEMGHLLKLLGGRLLTREPDPEWIPAEEVTLPHHASDQSPLRHTSHILLYEDSGVKEPLLKYNMKHVKTLPLSWLFSCIRACELVNPATEN